MFPPRLLEVHRVIIRHSRSTSSHARLHISDIRAAVYKMQVIKSLSKPGLATISSFFTSAAGGTYFTVFLPASATIREFFGDADYKGTFEDQIWKKIETGC